MTTTPGSTESHAPVPPTPTKESLSQFVAKVLSQLSLSAWLPAAALTLSLLFVVKLGAVLDEGSSTEAQTGPGRTLGTAVAQSASIGLGGAVVLVVAIVVLTIVTQAFSFGAIRVLEGYWGTNSAVERIASLRCAQQRTILERLDHRKHQLAVKAWPKAREALQDVDDLTPDMIDYIGATVLGDEVPEEKLPTPAQRDVADAIPWQEFADPDLNRQRLNLDTRLADYPLPERILPTRLGNVLRAAEDQAGLVRVESYIHEVFDQLSPQLQSEHDEQRTRLDLYCSMVFVAALVGVAACARLAGDHLPYALAALGISLVAAWLMYRAAIASARSYGSLLVTIAERHPQSG